MRKQLHRRLRSAEIEELVTGYQAGSTVYQLAEQYRINRKAVSKLLEREGVPRRSSRAPRSTEPLDVGLGENRFAGELHRYRIQAKAEKISVDATLTGEVPPWRPSTVYILFGADRSLEFACLPAVPHGAVTVTYSLGDEQHETTGSATTITTGAMSD